MSDADRLLAALRTGPKSAAELYRLGMMVHSRASTLRKRGHVIRCYRVPGKKGAAAFQYELLFDNERAPLSAVASSQTPKSDGGEAPALSGEQLALV